MDTRVVSILVLSLVLLVPATARSEASETGCEAPRQPVLRDFDPGFFHSSPHLPNVKRPARLPQEAISL